MVERSIADPFTLLHGLECHFFRDTWINGMKPGSHFLHKLFSSCRHGSWIIRKEGAATKHEKY